MSISVPNILVVDDSKAILIVMEAILNELGVSNKVTKCLSAQQALTHVTDDINFYDIVFTDLNMPEMDGMEFIRKLGELNFTGAVVIISEMDHKVINLAANLARHSNIHLVANLAKPVQLSQVKTVIQKAKHLAVHTDLSHASISEKALHEAINLNEIIPYYKPKINSQTSEIESIEVLARIVKTHTGEIISPNRFISLSEQSGLINQITFSLFEQATSDLKAIRTNIAAHLKLAFNLSPTQLDDLSCPNKLMLILQLNGLSPSDIILEITEQHALSSLSQLETLNRLRMHGFGISLDDFGVGFTNMNQIKRLPFTEIKIDRTLISNIETDQFSQVVVSSLVDIASQEQLALVAEGVERAEESLYLKNYRTNLAMQGFLFTCPKAKDDFIEWALNWVNTTGGTIKR